MAKSTKKFILVEPIAKTPYPPLGLMKIGTWLRKKHRNCSIFDVVGNQIPQGAIRPSAIYVTSLFTWDVSKVIRSIQFYSDRFPRAKIRVGGIAASLLPKYIENQTGISPHVGIFPEAETCSPDYSLSFNRKIKASITFASRGCPRNCRFCSVSTHEPAFVPRDDWEKDISEDFQKIVFWDNNWLASPNLNKDIRKIKGLGKVIDFNQGLDARYYTEARARKLSPLKFDPIRFAFDDVASERYVLQAIELAKKYTKAEIRVYVLYNFNDTPDDFFYRISLLNRHGALAFPMEYRKPTPSMTRFPGPHWDTALLRALRLTLVFYYRHGMITDSRKSFEAIYGKTPKQFVKKLYKIYEYDKELKRRKRC